MGFQTWQDFSKFSDSVQREMRYFHDASVETFLDAIVAASTCKNRDTYLKADVSLWRAQLGVSLEYITDDEGREWPDNAPFSAERMKPPIDSPQREGRINPLGISCLYLANNDKTAISEVRPWKGAHVSVAQLRTCRDLRIVDCTKHAGGHSGRLGLWMSRPVGDSAKLEKMTQEEISEFVWADIDASFSQPIGPQDEKTSYIPTQIIAEKFRQLGFTGIKYKSSTNKEGHNIALFDVADAEITSCHLFEVSSIEYETKEISNPYIIQCGAQVTPVVTDVASVKPTEITE